VVRNFESVLYTVQEVLQLRSMEERCNRSYLIEVYKIMYGLTDVPGLFFQMPLTVPHVATIWSWLNHIAIQATS